MITYNIHMLNARHDLTPILPEVRAAVNEGIFAASQFANLPPFDLIIRTGNEVVSDWGVGGYAPAPGQIQLTLVPADFNPTLIIRTIVHEIHHLLRWDQPGYGKSLGEALVSEGLAGHFVMQVLGGECDPWDAVTPSPDVTRRALNEWSRLDYDHAEWFFGSGKIRKWSGYGLGHRLISTYFAEHPEENAVTLAHSNADIFRSSIRMLERIASD